MAVTLHIDAQEVAALGEAWRRAPAIVVEETAKAIEEGTLLAEREVKERTPGGASGALRSSISARPVRVLGNNVIGEVSTSIGHAIPVELGTKAHFPPVAPIADWAVSKLGVPPAQAESVAYAIARKIAAKGTKGARMFEEGFKAVRPQVLRLLEGAGARIVARLAKTGRPRA